MRGGDTQKCKACRQRCANPNDCLFTTSRQWRRLVARHRESRTPNVCRYSGGHAWLMAQPGSGRLAGILCVGHRFEPSHVFAGLSFLHGDMFHTVFRGRAMPVFFVRRNPDGIPGANVTHRPAPRLHPSDARGDEKRLTERMRMPGGPRTWLEPHPSRSNASRIRRLDNWILPYRSGEARRAHPARGPRSTSDDIHMVSPLSRQCPASALSNAIL